jgi:hypothetical protein
MPANTNLTDGVLKLNEQLISLLNVSAVSTSYILKKASLKAGVDEIKSQDQNGAFRGRALALQDTEGTMTLQYTTAASKSPQPLQFFSAVDNNANTIKLILKDVGESFGAREESTVECGVCLAVGAVTATLPSLTAT